MAKGKNQWKKVKHCFVSLDESIDKFAVWFFNRELYHLMYNTSGGGEKPPRPPPSSLKRQLSLDSLTIDDSAAKRSDFKTTPKKMAAAKPKPISSLVLDAPVKAGGNTSANADNEGDIVTGDVLNRLDASVEQMNLNREGEEAATEEGQVETWAGKVKVKKVRKMYPYAAFIMSGDASNRIKISRKHFTAFTKHYNDACDELQIEDQDLIEIEFCAFEQGIGVVACGDSHTLKWIKIEAGKCIYDKKPTFAWARWERGSAMVYEGFLHGENYKYGEPPAVVIGNALKARNIPGSFTNCHFNTKPPNGVHVTFEPDMALAKELDKTMKLRVKAQKIKLGRHLRPQHTEAEFVEFLQAKNEEIEKRLRANEEKRKAAVEAAKPRDVPTVAVQAAQGAIKKARTEKQSS